MKCKHTKCPTRYLAWHEWAEKKMKKHKQIRCTVCGKFAIWIRNCIGEKTEVDR